MKNFGNLVVDNKKFFEKKEREHNLFRVDRVTEAKVVCCLFTPNDDCSAKWYTPSPYCTKEGYR